MNSIGRVWARLFLMSWGKPKKLSRRDPNFFVSQFFLSPLFGAAPDPPYIETRPHAPN